MKESTHQKQVIKHLRKNYPEVLYTVNPFAGMTFQIPEKLKQRLLAEAKAQGWLKSQPDMLIDAARCGFSSLAIELKKPDTYPFRPWKGNPNKFWIEESKDKAKKPHVMEQAVWLSKLKKEGRLAVFCESGAQAIELIDQYMNEEKEAILSRLDQWEFFWGKYVPVRRVVDYLVK